MTRLKTTTILVTSLALAVPLPLPVSAETSGTVQSCVAAKVKAGMDRQQARAQCGAGAPARKAPEQAGQTGRAQPQPPAPEAKAPPRPLQPKAQQPKPAQTRPEEPKPRPAPPAQPKRTKPQADNPGQPAPAPSTPPKAAQPADARQPRATTTPEPRRPKPDAQPAPAQPVKPLQPSRRGATQPTQTAPAVPDAPQSALRTWQKLQPQSAPDAHPPSPPSAAPGPVSGFLRPQAGTPATNDALRGVAVDRGAPPVEEVITRDSVRSPAQDFSTTPDGRHRPGGGRPRVGDGNHDPRPGRVPPGWRPDAPQTVQKKSGLSDFEKLAIAGLAAVAVGSLLSNGARVASNSGDRVVLRDPDGSYRVVKDDNVLLRQPGSRMSTENFSDGSSRTIVTKPDGSRIVTVYDPWRRIVQRELIEPDGRRYTLIDDSRGAAPVLSGTTTPRVTTPAVSQEATAAALARALAAEGVGPAGADAGRRYTLAQIRDIAAVRALAPAVSLDTVTFASGSSAITPDQAHALAGLGETLRDQIAANPREIYLVEGHTDAVGDPAYNLALSDRRAESLALALSDYFQVPAENLVVQGYGEEDLAVPTDGPSAANRRVEVRRITDLLQVAQD